MVSTGAREGLSQWAAAQAPTARKVASMHARATQDADAGLPQHEWRARHVSGSRALLTRKSTI